VTHSVIELCGSSTQLNDVMVKGENLKIPIFQVYVDTVGDAEKYRIKLSERFPAIKFVVAKKADSLFPVVSGASIVAKVVNSPFSLLLPI
jgi:ribonuclease HII